MQILIILLLVVFTRLPTEAMDMITGGVVGGGIINESDTLQTVIDRGKIVNNSTSFAQRVRLGDQTNEWSIWCDGSGSCKIALCANTATTEANCFTSHQKARDVDLEFLNTNNDSCFKFNKTTMALTITNNGSCLSNIAIVGTVTNLNRCRYNSSGTSIVCDLSPPVSNTPGADTYTMLASDCGKTIVNADADGLEVDLIADPTNGGLGCIVCFFAQSAQAIVLDPNGTDAIVIKTLTPSAGDSVTLENVVGAEICLQGHDASTWFGSSNATVTDTN